MPEQTKYISLGMLADSFIPREPTSALEIIDTEYLELFKDLPGKLQEFAGVTDKEINDLHYHGVMHQALADKLAKAFKTTPEYWINIQSRANAHRALFGHGKNSADIVIDVAKNYKCNLEKLALDLVTIKSHMADIRLRMENVSKALVEELGQEGSLSLKENEIDQLITACLGKSPEIENGFVVNKTGITGKNIPINGVSKSFKFGAEE